MKNLDEINRLISATEAELSELESSRSKLLSRAAELQLEKDYYALGRSPISLFLALYARFGRKVPRNTVLFSRLRCRLRS